MAMTSSPSVGTHQGWRNQKPRLSPSVCEAFRDLLSHIGCRSANARWLHVRLPGPAFAEPLLVRDVSMLPVICNMALLSIACVSSQNSSFTLISDALLNHGDMTGPSLLRSASRPVASRHCLLPNLVNERYRLLSLSTRCSLAGDLRYARLGLPGGQPQKRFREEPMKSLSELADIYQDWATGE